MSAANEQASTGVTLEEYSHFFEVQLDQFRGPIDLLLHLVKANELQIEKISLAQVTGQYLETIERMRVLDLEVAGEYLVIAATLLSIKASIILNEPVELVPDEDGNLIDPHQELLRRLREAEVFKESAGYLERLTYLGIDVFQPPPALARVPSPASKFVDHDPMLLGKAFRALLEKAGKQDLYTITLDSVSIIERMMAVMETLEKSGTAVPFYKLIPDLTSKASVIGTFVALLELCKRQAIEVRQDESFKEIVIARAVGAKLEAGSTSEFDVPAVDPNAVPGDEAASG